MFGRPWTAEEHATLVANYDRGADHVAALLGRSRASVLVHAHRTGVQTKPHWTEQEDTLLVLNWGHVAIAKVAKMVGRSHMATYRRARELGLGSGSPVGFEYLSTAAKRVGYDQTTLRKILRWAGVRVMEAATRPNDDRRFPRRYADPLDVDDAIAKWLATETIAAAAERHGIAGCTLKKWLRAAAKEGVAIPTEPRRTRQWRVPAATIDAVVAKRRSLEPIMLAAKRLGVTPLMLRRCLLAAGVERPATRVWLVRRDVAERAVAMVRGVRLAKAGARVADGRAA